MYFDSVVTTQVDVWRKIWEINLTSCYFLKIDLKDGFFGVPIDKELLRLFGFAYRVR